MMERDQIKAETTYRMAGGTFYRVLARSGQKLTIQRIDEIETYECSVGRFAARAISALQQTPGA